MAKLHQASQLCAHSEQNSLPIALALTFATQETRGDDVDWLLCVLAI